MILNILKEIIKKREQKRIIYSQIDGIIDVIFEIKKELKEIQEEIKKLKNKEEL